MRRETSKDLGGAGPDAEPADKGHRAFKTALYRLRGLLGESTLQLSAGRLRLDQERVWVDVFEFETLASNPEAGQGRRLLALYGGPFLPDQDDAEWATEMRASVRERFRNAVRRMTDELLSSGSWHSALELISAALQRDPLAEVFYQQALAACLAGGLRAETTAYYTRCRKALAERLGVDPSRKTESIYREVLRTVS